MCKNLYIALDISDQSVIVTDADLVIIQAVSKKFPLLFDLLSPWYLNKNVVVNDKKLIEDEAS